MKKQYQILLFLSYSFFLSQTTAWVVNTDINKLTIQNEYNGVGSNTSYIADNQMATYMSLFEA